MVDGCEDNQDAEELEVRSKIRSPKNELTLNKGKNVPTSIKTASRSEKLFVISVLALSLAGIGALAMYIQGGNSIRHSFILLSAFGITNLFDYPNLVIKILDRLGLKVWRVQASVAAASFSLLTLTFFILLEILIPQNTDVVLGVMVAVSVMTFITSGKKLVSSSLKLTGKSDSQKLIPPASSESAGE